MTFTGGEVDRIVDLLSELAPPSAVSMGFFTYLMMLQKSMLTENSVIDTDEVEDHLPAKIAIEVASIASEIASIAGEALALPEMSPPSSSCKQRKEVCSRGAKKRSSSRSRSMAARPAALQTRVARKCV